MSIKEIKSEEELKLASEKGKTLVQFTADWCGPCKMIKPILSDLSDEIDYEHVNFVSVNVDELPQIAAKYSVRGIPTLMLLEGDLSPKFSVGVTTIQKIKDFIG